MIYDKLKKHNSIMELKILDNFRTSILNFKILQTLITYNKQLIKDATKVSSTSSALLLMLLSLQTTRKIL